MEEKKTEKQDETKKDTAQKTVTEQKTKVPDSVKPNPSIPSSPILTPNLPVPSAATTSNGKRSPCNSLQQQLPPLQQPSPRYVPREVPPRFRQQEQRQLLKRGQPLPTGALNPTSACTQSGVISPPETPTSKRHTELPHQSGQGDQHENCLWSIPVSKNNSSNRDKVIINCNKTNTWPSNTYGKSHQTPECTLDTERTSEVVSNSSSTIMATGASQQGHYPISKASINLSSSMVSSQSGPTRGWVLEGKIDLSMGSRGQSNWGASNLNLNPSANPTAWPALGHEGPGVGSGPSSMVCSNPLSLSMCGQGGVAPPHSTNGNGSIGCVSGNLVGDCAWGSPDIPEQHQSPTNLSFNMKPPNLKNDGPNNTKPEPMSPVNSWRGNLSQSATEPASEDGTAFWGKGDAKKGESKDSGWDSAGVSSWGQGGASSGGGWGDWGKQPSTEGTGWDVNDGPSQEHMSSWGPDTPASEGSRDSSEGHPRRRERSSSDDLAPLLPRQDLDPRVICNTGWGQTPVRQHTVWEMEESPNKKNGAGTEVWGSSSNTPSAGPAPSPSGCACPNVSAPPRMETSKSEGPCRAMPNAGWGGSVPASAQPNSGWGEPPANKKVPNGSVCGWGDRIAEGPNTNGCNGQSWAEEKSPSWDDGTSQKKTQGWGDGNKTSSGWGSTGSGNSEEWSDPSEMRKNGSGSSSWEPDNRNWKETQKGWGKAAPAQGGSWGDGQHSNGSVQGWGGKLQESTCGNGGSGCIGSWDGPNSVKQSNSSWASGGRQDPGDEATGWKEPSPSSIRRKMEIDDGTSTWGDPSAYSKSVNMWDRNNSQNHPGTSNSNSLTGPNNNSNPHQHHSQGPTQNHVSGSNNNGSPNQGESPLNRMPMDNPAGRGELPNVQPNTEPTSWGEPANSNTSVNNGTSAWGQSSRGCGGWGEGGHDSNGGLYGRGNAPAGSGSCQEGPKSMQDGWGSGGEEIGMNTGQWDADDGDMWSSPTSQDSSCNSWSQSKKGPQRGKVSNKQDDVWIMTRLIKQLTDMGFPKDPAEEALKSNNMNLDQAMSALLEKKTELDKRGMGMSDYSNGMNKSIVCRPTNLSKDPSLDRAPFLDKNGRLSDDASSSPFMPSPGLKLPLANSSLPSHGLGGISSGLSMQNLNNRQMQNGMFGTHGAAQTRVIQQQASPPQLPVPPLSSAQPTLRAQVPQLLTPQVQAQLLQFAAKNIGLNPALLTSPINPQQMTLLYQLQQLHVAYQRLQIQQQMMQAQRNVSGPIKQQEQQVARTITNMQQQIQQHQRQLAQALLMKQQQPPPSSHTGLHPNLGKASLDTFTGHPQTSGISVSDLQTKEQQSSPNSFSPYTLSGLNPNMNVNCMEVGSLSLKDPPQPQSRLSQWTHSNSIDSLSASAQHMEANLNKHGSVSSAQSHVPVGKSTMEDSFSPYNLMSRSESLVSPDNWTQGKGPNEKISSNSNINWPPEFCPGVPWKGLQNIDPENDPNMTPGSVPSGPTINTNIQDVNRYLLRDRTGGKLLEMKSTWSPGPISHTQASLSHELWKVSTGTRNSSAPSRPPPGLTNTKSSSTWGGNSLGFSQGWTNSYSSEGGTWSTDSPNRGSSWLVLRNLTPQIDGSTLRTLCMQHGPLITFHLNLTQGNAVVRYSSKEETAKAQKSLHMCVLGNTTILAEFAGEDDVNRFFAEGQSLTPTTSWQASQAPGSNQPRLGNPAASHPTGLWSGGGGGTKTVCSTRNSSRRNGGDLLWGGVPQYSSLWAPPNGDDPRVIGSPIPINTLIPGDLLSGESM
ncbi:trinucleotide repeat-containing gene 6C protein-like isoform X3 [Sinocyclocheilus grahami]|uniref:trinucleotide repeat-containing gene 6C protein-like isoform X3 n=1 Tax=Sinocyclocheilus grahami TaxID=75366 RepID=UPI0007AC9888|nr:PREDICTED: trinucleotide repeat-containing gene 6C protein-like isoform X3 [Sinocyclocheilus grahami]